MNKVRYSENGKYVYKYIFVNSTNTYDKMRLVVNM